MIGWPVGRRERQIRFCAKVQIGAELLCKSVTHAVRERDRGQVGTWARGIREYRVWSIEYRLVEDTRSRGPEGRNRAELIS